MENYYKHTPKKIYVGDRTFKYDGIQERENYVPIRSGSPRFQGWRQKIPKYVYYGHKRYTWDGMDNGNRNSRQSNAQYDNVLFQGQYPVQVALCTGVPKQKQHLCIRDFSTKFISTKHYNEILWDTGATSSVTFDSSDIVHGTFVPENGLSFMKGLAKGLDIKGSGTVKYGVLDNNNVLIYLTSRAYYVPTATRRIFSPQAYFQHDTTSPDVLSSQNRLGIELKIPTDTTTNPNIVSILYNSRNNLPTFYACQVGTTATTDTTTTDSIKCGTKSIQSNFASLMSHVTEVINTNLSSAQKLLMSWHVRFGHFHLKAVQQVIRSRCLGTTPALRAAAKQV